MDQVINQKWYARITLVIAKEFIITIEALIDSGADLNCVSEGIIPTKYFTKTTQTLNTANGGRMPIEYKLSDVAVCLEGGCFQTSFLLSKDMARLAILGTPFLSMLYPFRVNQEGIVSEIKGSLIRLKFSTHPERYEINNIRRKIGEKEKFLFYLKEEVNQKVLWKRISSPKTQEEINKFQKMLEAEVCADVPNAFWSRKKFVVELPYEQSFDEKMIPTKARPIQMNERHLEICRKEINDLLSKGLIRKSSSPWSCSAFYVENAAELERGVPRLVINYKPLNKVLRWIRYPIPNKRDLLNRLNKAVVFSKFDMKSGYWQVQIAEKDKYKTAFTVPFGHYEWNVMPFGLKNAP